MPVAGKVNSATDVSATIFPGETLSETTGGRFTLKTTETSIFGQFMSNVLVEPGALDTLRPRPINPITAADNFRLSAELAEKLFYIKSATLF